MITLIAFAILINAARVQPLVPSVELSVIAQHRAELLCEKGQWSHENWLDSFQGMHYQMAGENLAKGFSSVKKAHEALMKSPTHKANILQKEYKEVGVGESCGIYVELFRG